MAGSRATLKDIAGATGFSVNTVSLALRASRRIPGATAALILAAAERLDYVPNRVARSLVSRATRTIGLILTDITNPTLTVAARAIERRLGLGGYSMMLAASDNDVAREIDAVEVLRSHQVDGLLIYPANHGKIDHIKRLRRTGFAVVLLAADRSKTVDIVAVDDRAGAVKATEHLISLGHRRIGVLDPAGPLGNREKREGYESALKRRGLAIDPALIHHPDGHGATSGYHAMSALMAGPRRPSAVFALTDNLALGALAWCRDHGIAVPGDMAITGYDNIEAAAFADVPLTSVNYETAKVSELAIERLLQLIDRPKSAPRVTLIEPDLVIRRSSGAGPTATETRADQRPRTKTSRGTLTRRLGASAR
jgi:LacI family transcriptional regulator